MEYDFYTLGVLYLVYSFAGWVGETVVATVRGRRFANRGAAAGPFCFVYGSTAVLLAVGFTDLRSDPVYLFFACTLASTVMEWLTAKLLERLHRRKWWDYSGKRFNLNGYVCLQYSLLWGVLGTASVLWLNGLLLRLCQVIPSWLLHPLVWAAVIVAALDQIGSAVLVGRYAAKHPVLEQLNQRLGESSDGLRRRIALYVEKRIQRAYPAAARQEPTIAQNGERPLSAADLLWLFVVGAFLGDLVETVFCRLTAGVWMSRSSLVWGPFSVVWGLALAMATVLLRQNQELLRMNRELRRLSENVQEMTREKEILEFKTRLHDEMGYGLTAVRQCLLQRKDPAELEASLEQMNKAVQLYRKDSETPPEENEWDVFVEDAAQLGVTVALQGPMPRQHQQLLLTIARECITNAVRYAGANRLEITITPQGGGQRWQFENDGPPPADPAITPGGGLTAIQRRVMQAGGTMEVQARPRYRLCVNLPKEETI